MIDIGRLERDLAATGAGDLILPRATADGIVAELRRMRAEIDRLRRGETIAELCAGFREGIGG